MKNLQELREGLDAIDTALVALLAERFKLTQEVGLYKKAHQLPPVDKQREALQFERITKLAEDAGLNPEYARNVLRLTIDEVVKNHKAIQGIKD